MREGKWQIQKLRLRLPRSLLKAQDWKVIGEVADQINIMVYDHSWATSTAGNIAPMSWIREVLDYAVVTLPKEKISLGINFYGYDWFEKSGADVLHEDVPEIIEEQNATATISEKYEKYFLYSKDEEEHSIYFVDSETVSKKLDLISEYDLKGMSIWRVGGEDPDNRLEISEKL